MKKFLSLLILTIVFIAIIPHPAKAAINQLVTCGNDANSACTFLDLVKLLVRLINYLIGAAAIVAMYYVLTQGFNLVKALGNEEKIKLAKEGISNAVVGFGMVVLAFVFVNLAVNLLFGNASTPRKWWDPACVFDITKSTSSCPLTPPTP